MHQYVINILVRYLNLSDVKGWKVFVWSLLINLQTHKQFINVDFLSFSLVKMFHRKARKILFVRLFQYAAL